MPKLGTSKNNFWGVKPFKYNDLASQWVDEGACQLSDGVKILKKRQKSTRVNALLNKYLGKQRHKFDYVDNAKE